MAVQWERACVMAGKACDTLDRMYRTTGHPNSRMLGLAIVRITDSLACEFDGTFVLGCAVAGAACTIDIPSLQLPNKAGLHATGGRTVGHEKDRDADAGRAGPTPARPAQVVDPGQQDASLQILLVEDEMLLAMVLEEMVMKAGHT